MGGVFRRPLVLGAVLVFAVAAPAAAQMQSSTTTTSPPGGSSSVTFGSQSVTPSSVAVVTTPPLSSAPSLPQALPSTVGAGTASAPIPARTGPNAPQELAIGLLVLMIGALVVAGMPKPGRHAKGYRR